jgi:hypothetical protein
MASLLFVITHPIAAAVSGSVQIDDIPVVHSRKSPAVRARRPAGIRAHQAVVHWWKPESPEAIECPAAFQRTIFLAGIFLDETEWQMSRRKMG